MGNKFMVFGDILLIFIGIFLGASIMFIVLWPKISDLERSIQNNTTYTIRTDGRTIPDSRIILVPQKNQIVIQLPAFAEIVPYEQDTNSVGGNQKWRY